MDPEVPINPYVSEGPEPEAQAPEDSARPRVRLTDVQIEQISSALRAGRALPPHLFPHVFEAPKEYQLSYRGKARRADVLAETMAMPFQHVRQYGEPSLDWNNLLVFGDNLQVLRQLLVLKERGQLRNADGTDGVRLCYIDPPFATRREFLGARKEQGYEDRVAGAEFVEFLRRRLILIKELLSSDGSLYVHLDPRKVHYVKVVLDELFGESNFRNEIVWKRTTSHSDAKKYGGVHETILYYAKSSQAKFRPPLVDLDPEYIENYYRYKDDDGERFMSADMTANHPGPPRQFGDRGYIAPPPGRQWAYNQEGIDRILKEDRVFWTRNGLPRRKIFLRDVKGMPAGDVWTDVLPIVSWSTERTRFPTQKPRALVRRIIEASSDPGDLVLDCFVGSGTTLAAAELAEGGARRWIGVDSGKFAMHVTQAELLRAAAEANKQPQFSVLNAGLYDFKSLKSLPWPEYREFVLQLFQCREEVHQIGGVTFDGIFGDHPVLVYNFYNHPDAAVGRSFVADLHALCGESIGDRCFIIAPAQSVEVFEEYLDAGSTRFYFLRVPYSVIAELHKRQFSELRQPDSLELANATIEGVGFDFNQPPDVECHYAMSDQGLVVSLKHFASQAMGAEDDPEAPISELALILLDYDFDGEIFDVDAVVYAEDLAKADNEIAVPTAPMGKVVGLIFVDVFGNEFREVQVVGELPHRKTAKKTTAKKTTTAKRTSKRKRSQ